MSDSAVLNGDNIAFYVYIYSVKIKGKVEILTYNIETRQEEYIEFVFPKVIPTPIDDLKETSISISSAIPSEHMIKMQEAKKAKALYYKRVWEITLSNDVKLIMGEYERGFHKHHIDHIMPIIYGYKNNIPAEQIGHISNLRPLYWKDNLLKAARYKP